MRRLSLLFVAILSGCALNQPMPKLQAQPTNATCLAADLVLHNTTVYTVNEAQWTAEAVASLGDKIVFVGSNDDAQAYMCGTSRVIDMAGKTVFAGFTDSHQHLEGVGRRTKTLSLFGIDALQATVAKIEEFAANIQDNAWVLGRGWIEREWTDEQRFLTKHDVDPFTQNKPLFMPRADGVSALVNSKANVAMGWTQTHDAGLPYRSVDLLKTIHSEGNMLHRVYVAVPVGEASEKFRRGREATADGMLDVRGIKVFIDGTLGSRGAALIENYADANHNGFMNRITKPELVPILHQALRAGVQVQTHVIGDRAVQSLLSWYEEAYNAVPLEQWDHADLRWRMEHAQVITPEDQQRFVDLAVIPSMQPSHGIGDLNFAGDRLGPERLAFAYPWQSLVERGLKIAAGSDAPVEVGDPRIEFYAAVARKRLDGTSGEGWHPEQAVSRATALKMLTLWPAYAAFQEDVKGSIEVGKYADFTVFDKDLMQIPELAIMSSQNVMTIVGGKIVYQRQ